MKKSLKYQNPALYHFVSEENFFMQAAKMSAKKSSDKRIQTGVVIVKNNKILSAGANYSVFHKYFFCIRTFLKTFINIIRGRGYFLCPGCQSHNHAEQTAIRNAKKKHISCATADLYLWGHWWACRDCWQQIKKAKISRVFLVKK